MQRLALVFGILVMVAFAWFYHSRTRFRPAPAPSPVAARGAHTEWWPLAQGALWEYQVVGKASFQRRGYYVQQVDAGGQALVLENTDGKQSDNFRVRQGPGDRVEFKEFQAAARAVEFLPEQLVPGARWNLKENLRAVAADLEEIRVPALGEAAVQAMRVEYEQQYGASETSEPGWYPAGSRWFVRGVGLVREDLEAADGPPELREAVRRERRVMHLTRFTAPWLKK